MDDIFEPRYPTGTIHNEGARLDYINTRSESPIEHKLAWSLLFSQRFIILPDEHAEWKLHHSEYGFVMQHKVDRFRLDMALFIHTLENGLQKVAVECDGKKYHTGAGNEARDKARDAILRREGYRVWRYAGWLIHNAADAVADEVHNAAQDIALGREPTLTFMRTRDATAPTLREYEQAFFAFERGVPWPSRMGRNPKQRGWEHIEDLFDWARNHTTLYAEFEDDY